MQASPPRPPVQQQQAVFDNSLAQVTLYTSTGNPVQVFNVSDDKYHAYRTHPANVLGILQIVLGILIVITQVVVTAMLADGFWIGAGFWATPLFILAGVFGEQSSKSKSRLTVITTMVLSIVGAVFTVGVVVEGALGIAFNNYFFSYTNHTAMAFFSLMLIFGFVEAIVAIMAAVFCCHGCCGQQPYSGVVINQVPTGAVGLVPVSPNTCAPTASGMSMHGETTPPPQYTEKGENPPL